MPKVETMLRWAAVALAAVAIANRVPPLRRVINGE